MIHITSDKLMLDPFACWSWLTPQQGASSDLVRNCRGVSGVAWAGAGNDQTVFSVGADSVACSINALTGEVRDRFEAGKHALTCVKSASGSTKDVYTTLLMSTSFR